MPHQLHLVELNARQRGQTHCFYLEFLRLTLQGHKTGEHDSLSQEDFDAFLQIMKRVKSITRLYWGFTS
ncbi:hypothetical protein ACYEXS_26920 [Paenibacillus sp. MAH-36]|uniref:hypothetical protein n=1 Tax=Paenibacillus sp. GCM10012304 TaxID=3317341 RepID=UPI00361F646B